MASQEERKDSHGSEHKEQPEPDEPPVDGPSTGSGGERPDRDVGDSSYGQPGGSGS
jgi:hypothetical protein